MHKKFEGDAVFQSTGQALFFSFLIMSVEPRQKNALRQYLIRAIEEMEAISPKLRAWLEQLRGDGSGTVNFSGLTSDEIRAQCAMITQIVRDHLPEPEMHAVHARFIPTATEEISRDAENQPVYRFFFDGDRAVAVKWLAHWISKTKGFPQVPAAALDFLVAKLVAERPEVDISFRDLAKYYGQHHMVYFRAYGKAKEHMKGLEGLAMARLTTHFERTGLVEAGVVDTSREVKVWRFGGKS